MTNRRGEGPGPTQETETMRYQPRIDIWTLDADERARLQPGQAVSAGPDGPTGTYLGGTSHSQVVAWDDNARGHRRSYHKQLRTYARSIEQKGN